MVCGNLGADVTDDLIRGPHIPANHIQDAVIRNACIIQLQRRHEEPFFKDLVIIRGNSASYIRMMKDTRRKGNGPILKKDRAQNADVIQMSGQEPRVVHDDDIPWPILF